MNKTQFIEWETQEYEHKNRSPDWFWSVGIMAVAGAITSIILNNILFAVIIILASFSLLIYARRHPDTIIVTLDNKGVRIDKYFYPYHTLESFWVEENDGPPKIILKSQKLIMPYIVVQIENVDPNKVRRYLEKYIPEVFHNESHFHKIMERLGF